MGAYATRQEAIAAAEKFEQQSYQSEEELMEGQICVLLSKKFKELENN